MVSGRSLGIAQPAEGARSVLGPLVMLEAVRGMVLMAVRGNGARGCCWLPG